MNEHLYGCPCNDCLFEPALRREVLPVLRRRLELVAVFAAVSALTFWATAMW